MKFFIKILGKKVQNAVGWEPPLKQYVIGRSIGELKPKQECDKLDNESSEENARALYNIFNRVSHLKFRRIVTCKCAKEAWDILEVT